MDRISQKLLNLAVSRLPMSSRGRYHEEWSAHLDEIPVKPWKWSVAAGFSIAAFRISPELNLISRLRDWMANDIRRSERRIAELQKELDRQNHIILLELVAKEFDTALQKTLAEDHESASAMIEALVVRLKK